MKIGEKFNYKSHDRIRTALFLEDLGDRVEAITYELDMTGISVQINKNLIL